MRNLIFIFLTPAFTRDWNIGFSSLSHIGGASGVLLGYVQVFHSIIKKSYISINALGMENFLSISTVNNASQVHMLIYKVIKLSNFSLQMHYSKCTSSYVSFSALA